MPDKREVDIGKLIRQQEPVLDAIRRGGREAMKQYILANKSMVSWKDGKIYMIPPEELAKMLEQENE